MGFVICFTKDGSCEYWHLAPALHVPFGKYLQRVRDGWIYAHPSLEHFESNLQIARDLSLGFRLKGFIFGTFELDWVDDGGFDLELWSGLDRGERDDCG